MRRLLLALAAASLATACGGSQTKAEDMNWSSENPETSRPLRETEELNPPPGTSGSPDQAPTATWVGVRHDVMIAPSTPHTERCACLAVEVGGSRDAKFQWQGKVPEVGADATVIAVSARGVSCPGGPADEAKRRPSIAGVHREGNDVVVDIEELPEGRPLASGAILARPAPGGSLYVRPRSVKLPYARTPAGRCRVN